MSPPITKCIGGGFNKTQGQFSVSKKVNNNRDVDFESGSTGFINCIGTKFSTIQNSPPPYILFSTPETDPLYNTTNDKFYPVSVIGTDLNEPNSPIDNGTTILKDIASFGGDDDGDQYPPILGSDLKNKRNTVAKFCSTNSVDTVTANSKKSKAVFTKSNGFRTNVAVSNNQSQGQTAYLKASEVDKSIDLSQHRETPSV